LSYCFRRSFQLSYPISLAIRPTSRATSFASPLTSRIIVSRAISSGKMSVVKIDPSSVVPNGSSDAKLEIANREPLVWVDLEMTGLDINTRVIVEMAAIITDWNLDVLAVGPNLVIHRDENVVKNMDVWCVQQFHKTGLTNEICKSTISIDQAQQQMVDFIKKYTKPGKSPLCGNSIHVDRQFLLKEMPAFMEHLSYRIVDVSSIKELAARWFPSIVRDAPKKNGNHRALDDIRDSIAELKYYRSKIFSV